MATQIEHQVQQIKNHGGSKPAANDWATRQAIEKAWNSGK